MAPDQIRKWEGAHVRNAGNFYSTISRFGERSRDGQYSETVTLNLHNKCHFKQTLKCYDHLNN